MGAAGKKRLVNGAVAHLVQHRAHFIQNALVGLGRSALLCRRDVSTKRKKTKAREGVRSADVMRELNAKKKKHKTCQTDPAISNHGSASVEHVPHKLLK
jgi:ribose 1,5-bisphosphokinase PhnN